MEMRDVRVGEDNAVQYVNEISNCQIKTVPSLTNQKTEQIILDSKTIEDLAQLSEISRSLTKILEDIENIYTRLNPQKLIGIKTLMTQEVNTKTNTSLSRFIEQQVTQLKNMGKHTTAQKYASTLRQFMIFQNGQDIPLESMTSFELKRFEQYLLQKGVVMNTVSFYMRVLRAVYNKAIKEGVTLSGNPFKDVYTGVAKTNKRAITEDIIRLMQQTEFVSSLALARDMFLFSFYTRGMAFVDMANLKKNNIVNGVISYKRSKTGQRIQVGLEPCMREIIERYSYFNQTEYLLPIRCQKGKLVSYETAIRTQNQRLKLISNRLKLPVPLTTYVARHSWASIARRKGIALPIISEGMGHTSEKTTRIYLTSFDQNIIDNANRKIIDNTRKRK